MTKVLKAIGLFVMGLSEQSYNHWASTNKFREF